MDALNTKELKTIEGLKSAYGNLKTEDSAALLLFSQREKSALLLLQFDLFLSNFT